MKMHVHRSIIATGSPVSLQALKAYIRVTHDDEDLLILKMGLAAAAEIESYAQIALLHQTINVTIFYPVLRLGMNLPIGPAPQDAAATMTLDGEPFTDFSFAGGNRPYVEFTPSSFHLNPKRLTISYPAGFGEDHSSIPIDLAQAIQHQVSIYYDGRSQGKDDPVAVSISGNMARIGARYRGVSI